jgi:hypothetical protein
MQALFSNSESIKLGEEVASWTKRPRPPPIRQGTMPDATGTGTRRPTQTANKPALSEQLQEHTEPLWKRKVTASNDIGIKANDCDNNTESTGTLSEGVSKVTWYSGPEQT